jgi:acyl-CoA reductase-like NAD-dependent aldehyde dehydrogenase
VTAIQSNYSTSFPNGTLDTPDMSKMINGKHHKRVLDLLATSKGQQILGGGHNQDKIELTVLKDVPADDPLVKE